MSDHRCRCPSCSRPAMLADLATRFAEKPSTPRWEEVAKWLQIDPGNPEHLADALALALASRDAWMESSVTAGKASAIANGEVAAMRLAIVQLAERFRE